MICLLAAGCARRKSETATSDKLNSCAPADVADDRLKLTISSVTNEPQATKVGIVVAALDQAIEFDLPVYWLSRGRWLIGNAGRAYLLDEECREHKLKDRKSVLGEAIPPDGRIKLNPGQTFEAILVFPRLPDRTRAGRLVYGKRSLAFSIGT